MSTEEARRDVRHVKAARELLRWDQGRLAEESGLSLVSVRRYEAGTGAVADRIERDIILALEKAGAVFVSAGELDDMEVSGGVLLRSSAQPDEPAAKKVYVYGVGKSPGRPVGRRDASARRSRAVKPDQIE
jgi:transcriptional regulator with XRE-family HTH domain